MQIPASIHEPQARPRRLRGRGYTVALSLSLAFALAACGAGGGSSAAPGDAGDDGLTTPAPLESGDAMETEGTGTTE